MTMQQVHLRFNDAAGQPTAVRLRITDAADRYHAPYGRRTEFATDPGVDLGCNVSLDGVPWAFIDGACEISLPPGPLKVQARKGLEYRPLDLDVDLLPGKMSMRFTMERWIDMPSRGWRSGDVGCYNLSPHAALLEGMAEDLAVVDLLIRDDCVNIAAYSGQSPALEKPGGLVAVNTANRGPDGTLLLLNTHRIVFPLSFERGEKWSLADLCDQCHRKKGLVVADDWLIRDTPDDYLARVDAVRFHPNVPLEKWFAALDRGLRLPLVAGSAKTSNRDLLGSWRTYAHVESLTYANWIEAIRAGRTFVTNGPMLTFDGTVAEASSRTSIDRLQIIADGKVVAETSGPTASFTGQARWRIARCDGPAGTAFTSPIFDDTPHGPK